MTATPAAAEELLALTAGFDFGARAVDAGLRARIDTAVQKLTGESPPPDMKRAFDQLDGTWRCVFTDSRHVLGLNGIPFVRLARVRQRIVAPRGAEQGISYNIGELERRGSVKLVCGERARLRPSAEEPDRVDLDYEHFYCAHRIFTPYEGSTALSQALVTGTLRGSFRLPFRKPGWQRHVYMGDRLRVLHGNSGGLFVMVRDEP